MEYKRKNLRFNVQEPKERDAYDFLEKIRYFQSDFITRLINDFLVSHDINKNTPYNKVRAIVVLYIKGINIGEKLITSDVSDNTDFLNLIMQLTNSSSAILHHNTDDSQIAVPIEPPVAQPQMQPQPEILLQNQDETTSSVSLSENPFTITDDEDDEDGNDEVALKMAKGFKDMI